MHIPVAGRFKVLRSEYDSVARGIDVEDVILVAMIMTTTGEFREVRMFRIFFNF